MSRFQVLIVLYHISLNLGQSLSLSLYLYERSYTYIAGCRTVGKATLAGMYKPQLHYKSTVSESLMAILGFWASSFLAVRAIVPM